jgi:hypothetical protein
MEERLDETVLRRTGRQPEVPDRRGNRGPDRQEQRGAALIALASNRGNVKKLEKMPKNPTLQTFRLRLSRPTTCAERNARDEDRYVEEIILARLCSDVALNLIAPDHGWWALSFQYIPEKSTFAIRYHQTLRFTPTKPATSIRTIHRIFGTDYTPPAYIEATYKMLKNHKWYMEPRLVTVNDLYAFDPNAKVSIDPFIDIVGRHFKQPKEGLGFDNSPSAHMWRTIASPDQPL